MTWRVLDSEPDIVIANGFATSQDAVDWIAAHRATETDPELRALYFRVVVSPNEGNEAG